MPTPPTQTHTNKIKQEEMKLGMCEAIESQNLLPVSFYSYNISPKVSVTSKTNVTHADKAFKNMNLCSLKPLY